MTSNNGVLLDTSIVIDHFRGDRRISEPLEHSKKRFIATIALGELRYGALRSRRFESHEKQLAAFLGTLTVIPIDEETTRYYARIRYELAKLGSPIPENDIWIASVALQHGLPLVTRDRHFQHIPSLELLHW